MRLAQGIQALGWLALAGCGRPLAQVWGSQAHQPRLACWVAGEDVDGDGWEDLLTGVYGSGAALFRGGPAGLGREPAWRFKGGGPSAVTGLCVGSAGDMDGDGHPELFVAAPRDAGRGAVYLFKGGEEGPGPAPWKVLWGQVQGEGFGELAAGAGDLNGDGYADLAVADFAWDSHRGRVNLYHGGPAGPQAQPDWWAAGEAQGDWFGYSLCAAGDLDGDGYADLAISGKNCSGACVRWMEGDPRFELHRRYLESLASGDAATLARAGKLYLYYGSRTGLGGRPGLTLEGELPHSNFGFKVAALKLPGAAGKRGLLVSSPGWMARKGRLEVYAFGPRGRAPLRAWEVEGGEEGEELGYFLGLAGDLDGDGLAEIYAGSMRRAWLKAYAGTTSGWSPAPRWQARIGDGGWRIDSVAGLALNGRRGPLAALAVAAAPPGPQGRAHSRLMAYALP